MHLLLNRNTISIIFVSFLFLSRVSAATLSIIPASVAVEEGRPFTVGFYVSNNIDSLNAISAHFSYTKDKLKFNSFSRVDSILQMWSIEPRYDALNGTGTFEGVILNPGFSNAKGLLLKANFTPLSKGVATISFTSGNIYANDGSATDVLSTLGKTTITITPAKESRTDVASEYKPVPVVTNMQDKIGKGLKGDIAISSDTHPDENLWYAKNDLKLLLELDPKATDISTALTLENDIADRVRSKPVRELSYAIKDDGVYLFLVKQKLKNVWGKDSQFRVHVDTTPPSEVVGEFLYGASSTKVSQRVTLSAKDALSDIMKYDISLNGSPVVTERAEINGIATSYLPKAKIGQNKLSVTAYDAANNSKEVPLYFVVTPLESPKVTFFTKKVSAGSLFTLQAKTYPKGTLSLLLQNKKESIQKKVVADEVGTVSLSLPVASSGKYDVSVQLVDFEDGESYPVLLGQVSVTFDFLVFVQRVMKENGALLLTCFFLMVITSFVTFRLTKTRLTQKTSESMLPAAPVLNEEKEIVKETPASEENPLPPPSKA